MQAGLHAKAVHEGNRTLVLIALFKLIKGLLLVAAGIGAVKLLHRDVADTVMHWINVLRVDPDNRLIHGLLTKILWVNPNQLKALSAGTFIYAGLLLTEGTGLLLRKTWAEYFTIITTAGLIPLELYEIAKHFTAVKIIVLAVNVAIVVYLVARVRHSRNRPNAPMSRPVPCRTRSPHRFEFRAVSSVSRETHPPCDA